MDGPDVWTLTGSANQAGEEWQALRRLTVLTVDEALSELRSAAEGLSAGDAAGRLAWIGRNELPKAHGPGLVKQLLDQLLHFFALMFSVAAGLATDWEIAARGRPRRPMNSSRPAP